MAEIYSTEDALTAYGAPEDEQYPALGSGPGDDVAVAPYDSLSVIQYVTQCLEESEDAREPRDRQNRINQDAAHCRQDLSNKVPGQSQEFVPMLPMALEQFGAFIKRGMVGYGNYFSVELSPSPTLTGGPLTESGIVKLMRHRLENPEELPPGALDFPTIISDGTKIGALEASMIVKVHGTKVPTRRLSVKQNTEVRTVLDPVTRQPIQTPMVVSEDLVMEEGRVWRLLVELIRPQDYFPDPTGRGLYEIQRTYKDLYKVIEGADAGDYDAEAVAQLVESFSDPEVESELERETDQPQVSRPDFRKQIEILEFWGTILDSDGHVACRNCRTVVANRRYILRKPEDNPYWHQESCFVPVYLLRVPFATFHKALFDYAVRLNLAMNELFNLIIDGAIGSVWGNRQVKPSRIENMDDFTDGIPQGATFLVAEEQPDGQPVVLNTPSGVVPPEALQTYGLLRQEFNAATLLSSTAKGETPRKEVSATATASADQSTGMFLDSIVAELEAGLCKILRLCWLTMLQNADDWNADDVAGCIGPEAAQALAQMSPAQRYKTYAQGARFKVSGLSSMLARTREFQKVMAVLGATAQSPMLTQVAMTEMSPKKLFYHLLRSINLDPEDLKITEEEQASLAQRIAQLPLFAQTGTGGAAGGAAQAQNNAAQQSGSPTQQTQASIAQMNQPPQGF
jgi:hypothetical protein